MNGRILVTLAMVGALGTAEAEPASGARAQIEEAMRTVCEGLTKGDADLVGSVLVKTEELRSIGPEGVTRGFAAFDKGLRDWFKDARVERCRYEDPTIRLSARGDMAWFTATLRMSGIQGGKERFDWTIHELGVFENRGGRWLYAGWAEQHAVPPTQP